MDARACSVAGMFYPREPSHLEQLLEGYLRRGGDGKDARGIVAPHAGYIYSGAVAGKAFGSIPGSFDGTFVIIGPSHRGFLTCASAVPWETPLGIVDSDAELVRAMDIPVDEFSHRSEHSIEVQVPFVKYRFPRARIAAVMMGDQGRASAAALAGKILAGIRATGRNVRIVASSDFSHYVPDAVARDDDLHAIRALERLDTEEFIRRVEDRGVSACGTGPIVTMCTVCRELGATRGDLLQYATSGDVTGDLEQVVGYAALAVV